MGDIPFMAYFFKVVQTVVLENSCNYDKDPNLFWTVQLPVYNVTKHEHIVFFSTQLALKAVSPLKNIGHFFMVEGIRITHVTCRGAYEFK